MPALPSRIAKSTVDGVVVERVDPAIKTTHANAVDQAEIEMFFDNELDAQALLDERWAWQSNPARLREAVEFDGSLGLGTRIPLAPAVPAFEVSDASRGVSGVGAVRSYATNYDGERFAVELIGVATIDPDEPLSISGAPDTSVSVGDDYSFLPIVAGGEPPYHFTISGPVPASLSFDPATGALSGLITGGLPATLTVGGTVPVYAPSGTPYAFTPDVAGGTPLYSFSIDGDLPPGLFFDTATGEIAGVPD